MAEFIVSGVSKSFGAVRALDKVDFAARTGEVHSILGENGAGKSTLIKIMSGVQPADEGSISFDGVELKFHSPKEAIDRGIGTVFQELSLMRDLTVAQNIFFGEWPKGKGPLISKRTLNEKTRQLFDKYEIDDIDPGAVVENLPLSQQQIVEIVKILSRSPKVVIFDEATSALTQNRVHWLLSLARKLADDGKLVIFISHRLQEIRQSCDRVTVFRNGKDVGVRELKEADNDELISMMIGRKLSAYFPEWQSVSKEETALEVKGASAEKMLDNISFTLKKGEVLGVGGLAGQGQVPLFLALGGMIRLHSGEIIIDGKRARLNNPSDGMRNGLALIPEDRSTEGLIQTMSIKDNLVISALDLVSRHGVIDRKKEERVVNEAVERLSIKMGGKNDLMMSLSGGNQQKVLISKFLMLNPRVFLMLDPTRGVDIGTKSEIFKLVRNFAESGNSVLYYSTDMSELTGICDRVMVMYDNTVFGTLGRDMLTSENILKYSVGEQITNGEGAQ